MVRGTVSQDGGMKSLSAFSFVLLLVIISVHKTNRFETPADRKTEQFTYALARRESAIVPALAASIISAVISRRHSFERRQ